LKAPLTSGSRLTPPGAVRYRQLGDETIVLHLETSQLYSLDAVAARMWMAILESSSLGAARDALLERYEVSRERLEADLLTFAGELLELGLLEVESG